MPLYPPPAGTYSEHPPPVLRPSSNRASTNINATAEKYRPRTYSHPPPTQPNPTLLGPTYAAQPIQTPYPQQELYTTAPPPLPMPQPAPIYPPPPHQYPQPVAFRHGSHAQPPRPPLAIDDPRSSHSSQRSRPSHDSRRSRHSRHSHDDRRHGDDGRAKRDHRVSIDDIDRRPTMGDSVIAFYKLVKSALGPRDK
jgi:hypothetical protein